MEKVARNMIIFATIAVVIFATYAYFNPISKKFYFTKSDELMHITGFSIIAFLIVCNFPQFSRLKLVFWLCAVGVFVEVAQPLLTERRELSYSDMIANCLGVFAGVIAFGLIVERVFLKLKDKI